MGRLHQGKMRDNIWVRKGLSLLLPLPLPLTQERMMGGSNTETLSQAIIFD